MVTLEDSYSFANNESDVPLRSGSFTAAGQSFTASTSQDMYSAVFEIKKVGSPTGNVYAKLYSHTGTFGSSGTPGTLLATSDAIDISTLSTSYAEVTFNFTGAEQYTLTSTTNYFIVVEYTGGNSTNNLTVHYDGVAGLDDGNLAVYNAGWSAFGTLDVGYEVYSEAGTPPTGYSNDVNGIANANISKITKISVSNINKVNGV